MTYSRGGLRWGDALVKGHMLTSLPPTGRWRACEPEGVPLFRVKVTSPIESHKESFVDPRARHGFCIGSLALPQQNFATLRMTYSRGVCFLHFAFSGCTECPPTKVSLAWERTHTVRPYTGKSVAVLRYIWLPTQQQITDFANV